MPSRNLPNIGLTAFWDLGEDLWKTGMDSNLLALDTLTQLVVASATTVLPGSPTAGDTYIVRSDDGTNPNKIAVYDNGAWVYITPKDGWRAWVVDAANLQVYTTGGGWAAVSGGGGSVGVSDEDTLVLASPTNINFTGAGVTVTDDGDGTLSVSIPGGGGGSGGYSFEFNPVLAEGSPSTSTNAAKGNLYVVNEDCTLHDVLIKIQNVDTSPHKIVVARYDQATGTRTVQEVLAETTPRTAAGEYLFEKFVTPIALTAGWIISVLAIRTDGTATSACEMVSGTRAPTDYRSEIEVSATLAEQVTTVAASDTHNSAGNTSSAWRQVLGLSS